MYGIIRWAPICLERQKQLEESSHDRQDSESIGRLAEGLAHSFNNLLTVILGNASLALEGIAPDAPAYSMLEEVMRSGHRAALLIKQLLVYSGQGHFLLQPINISELMRDISVTLRSFVSRQIEMQFDLCFDLPPVRADSAYLEQLIVDLAINGAEAIGENKNGVLVITTAARNINDEYLATHQFAAGAVRPGRFVMLGVHDNGTGMDKEAQARVFEPLFRTESASRGLRMAAARGIVEGHHGAILVDSAPETGSTFWVLLPTAEVSPYLSQKAAS